MAFLRDRQAVMCEYVVDDQQVDVFAPKPDKIDVRLRGSCRLLM